MPSVPCSPPSYEEPFPNTHLTLPTQLHVVPSGPLTRFHSTGLLSNLSSPTLYVYPGLPCPNRRIQHLLFLDFMRLVIAQPTSVIRISLQGLSFQKALFVVHYVTFYIELEPNFGHTNFLPTMVNNIFAILPHCLTLLPVSIHFLSAPKL